MLSDYMWDVKEDSSISSLGNRAEDRDLHQRREWGREIGCVKMALGWLSEGTQWAADSTGVEAKRGAELKVWCWKHQHITPGRGMRPERGGRMGREDNQDQTPGTPVWEARAETEKADKDDLTVTPQCGSLDIDNDIDSEGCACVGGRGAWEISAPFS